MENAFELPQQHEALKKALNALGSYGTIAQATGLSRGYWCSIAQGQKRLTSTAAERLIAKFPHFMQTLQHCPTCGQKLNEQKPQADADHSQTTSASSQAPTEPAQAAEAYPGIEQ